MMNGIILFQICFQKLQMNLQLESKIIRQTCLCLQLICCILF